MRLVIDEPMRREGDTWRLGLPVGLLSAAPTVSLHVRGADKAPALDGALVNLDCEIASATETGSHSIFIGEVRAIRFGTAPSPLLHFNRSFFTLAHTTAL